MTNFPLLSNWNSREPPCANGRAVPIDIGSEPEAGFRQALLDIYVPRYGAQWETDFLDSGPRYARIDAERMFTFSMPAG